MNAPPLLPSAIQDPQSGLAADPTTATKVTDARRIGGATKSSATTISENASD
jgi:hypothetical protein